MKKVLKESVGKLVGFVVWVWFLLLKGDDSRAHDTVKLDWVLDNLADVRYLMDNFDIHDYDKIVFTYKMILKNKKRVLDTLNDLIYDETKKHLYGVFRELSQMEDFILERVDLNLGDPLADTRMDDYYMRRSRFQSRNLTV